MSDDERSLLASALPGYDIGGEIGRGACGIVLGGRHRELGREVAIMRLPRMRGADSEVRARFLLEARLLASLDHPHIVRIYDFVDVDGDCALVMQRLTGGTVWERLQRGQIARPAACAVTVATCSALHYGHAKHVLHRDIRPQNLLFSDDSVLKVAYFGIAELLRGGEATATRTDHVLATAAYIAPEQVQGATPGPSIDVYAAGMVLYVLLCGRLPFPPAADPMAEPYQHVHLEPVSLLERDPHAPVALAEVAACALARDPEERYPSALQLADAVTRAAAHEWGPGWAAGAGVTLLAAEATNRMRPLAGARAGSAEGTIELGGAPAGTEHFDAWYVSGADETLISRLYGQLAGREGNSAVSRVRALCRLAIELHLAGAPAPRCRALIAEAEELASALYEPATDVLVLYSRLAATWSPDDLRERTDRADEVIARARELDDPAMVFAGRRLRLRALLEAGDDAATDAELNALDATAAELGGSRHHWQAALYRATAQLRDGDADAAEPLMREAFELGRAGEPDVARRCFDDQATRHRWLVGAKRDLIPGLREAAESCPWLPVRRAALTFGLAELGRRTEAAVQFEELAREEFASVPRDANWLLTMVFLALACGHLDEGGRVRILYDALEPYRDRFTVTGDCTATWGPVAAALDALDAVR